MLYLFLGASIIYCNSRPRQHLKLYMFSSTITIGANVSMFTDDEGDSDDHSLEDPASEIRYKKIM